MVGCCPTRCLSRDPRRIAKRSEASARLMTALLAVERGPIALDRQRVEAGLLECDGAVETNA